MDVVVLGVVLENAFVPISATVSQVAAVAAIARKVHWLEPLEIHPRRDQGVARAHTYLAVGGERERGEALHFGGMVQEERGGWVGGAQRPRGRRGKEEEGKKKKKL